jgi:hypothetical protein
MHRPYAQNPLIMSTTNKDKVEQGRVEKERKDGKIVLFGLGIKFKQLNFLSN